MLLADWVGWLDSCLLAGWLAGWMIGWLVAGYNSRNLPSIENFEGRGK